MLKRTKIICTLGPAVDDEDILRSLIEAGMDVARLNFSHGSHEEHRVRIDRVKAVREALGAPTAIMLDTKGPEIRTGLLAGGGPIHLSMDSEFVLTAEEAQGDGHRVSQSSPELPRTVKPGDEILIDDGLIGLRVVRVQGEDVICRVENSGMLGQRKSINVPGVSVPMPAITEQDRADLLFGIAQDVDYVAASFVRNAAGIQEIRDFLRENGGGGIRIIAKVENADAVRNIDEIIAAADGVMVARGDLGVEVPEYKVPHLQKYIIRECNRMSKPVITATQMLDSMIRNPRPTRAEVADVANAIYDGTDCVMLSGETAVGAYPVQAVRTMVDIARETEPRVFDENFPDRNREQPRVSLAVGSAAVSTAESLEARCIVTPTMSGRTARLISNLRPRMPIYAVTPFPKIRRQMQLSWGVLLLLADVEDPGGNMRHIIAEAYRAVMAEDLMKPGDLAVFTVSDPGTAPHEEEGEGLPFGGITPANVMMVVEVS